MVGSEEGAAELKLSASRPGHAGAARPFPYAPTPPDGELQHHLTSTLSQLPTSNPTHTFAVFKISLLTTPICQRPSRHRRSLWIASTLTTSPPSITPYAAFYPRRLQSVHSHRLLMACPHETISDTFQRIARRLVPTQLLPRKHWKLQEDFENSSIHMSLWSMLR
jgi:hypothetical protein